MTLWRIGIICSALVFLGAVGMVPAQDAGASPPSTSVVIPSNNAIASGTSELLDAAASPAASEVQFVITGGTVHGAVIATATATYYGWLAQWNTTTVANGTYSLQSVASFSAGTSVTSAPLTITVSNAPPSTTVVIPASGATLDTAQNIVLDAAASPGVTQVSILVSANGVTMSSTATPTIYGWIAIQLAEPCSGCTAVPLEGTVESVATYAGGVTGTSSPVDVTVLAYTNQI